MPHLSPDGGGRPSSVLRALPAPRQAQPEPEPGPEPAQARLRLGVPGYAHPLVAPLEWGELARSPAVLDWAVLNVANGAGARPDPHCLEAAGRLRSVGARVLGHVDMRGGYRAFGELVTDAHRFLEWYRVDGFYLDRCPPDDECLREVRRTTATFAALAPGAHLVLGHGTHPHPGYAELGGQLVTFSGRWPEYRWSQAAEWTADHPAERFCHLVRGVPPTHLDEAMRIARWQGAASVFFTDRTTWEAMPGYWDDIVSRVGQPVSE